MKHSKPFPYIVIDDFLSPEDVAAINSEWPDDWDKEDGKFTKKWNSQGIGPKTQAIIDSVSPGYIGLETGLEGLFADPDLFGAGLHCVPPGGFLNMHVDFNLHPNGWHRKVNVLIYLNEAWDDCWGGHLCLGKEQEVKIAPVGGRCVMFETTEDSWHGHPEPLACPDGVQRRSLALYFYAHTKPEADPHSTIYEKRKK